jgi:hypothetical protein
MVNLEKSGTDLGANGGRLNGSVIGTARNVVERGNQFSGGVQGSMLEEKVNSWSSVLSDQQHRGQEGQSVQAIQWRLQNGQETA